MKATVNLTPGRTFATWLDMERLDRALESIGREVIEWEAVDHPAGARCWWAARALAIPQQTEDGRPYVLFDWWGPSLVDSGQQLPGLADMGSADVRYLSAADVQSDADESRRARFVSDWVAPWAIPLGEGAAAAVRGAWSFTKVLLVGVAGVGVGLGLLALARTRGRR